MEVNEPQLSAGTSQKRSVASFVERLTDDYFLATSADKCAASAVDPGLAMPSLGQLVPNLANLVGTVCHLLDIIHERHVPTSYQRPLEKPLVIPAALGYVLSVVVSHFTGVRVPVIALDELFSFAIHRKPSGVSISRVWLTAKECVHTAAAVKWQKANGTVGALGPHELIRVFAVKTASDAFDDGCRVIEALQEHISREPNHFLALVWQSLFRRLSCQVYVHKVVSSTGNPSQLLCDTLRTARALLSSVKSSYSENARPQNVQRELLMSTSADIAIACIVAGAQEVLGNYFGLQFVTEDTLSQSAVLLAQFHADVAAYLRFLSHLSPHDERLLDTVNAVLAPKRPQRVTAVLPLELFGTTKMVPHGQSLDVSDSQTFPHEGTVKYVFTHAGDGHFPPTERETAVSCTLVKCPGSLKRFRDVILPGDELPLSSTAAPDERETNGARDTVFLLTEEPSGECVDLSSPNSKLDQVVRSLLLSDRDRQRRKALLRFA